MTERPVCRRVGVAPTCSPRFGFSSLTAPCAGAMPTLDSGCRRSVESWRLLARPRPLHLRQAQRGFATP